MSTDFPIQFTGDKFCLDDLNDAMSLIWKKVCDLEVRPPSAKPPEGVLLADGSVPVTGCLTSKNGGCLGDDNLARWKDIREWFDAHMCAFTAEKATDINGCFDVPFNGATFTEPPVLSVVQAGLASQTPAIAVGSATFAVTKVTPTQATICVYGPTGAPLANSWVKAYVTAMVKP